MTRDGLGLNGGPDCTPALPQSPPDSPPPAKSRMPHGYPHSDPGVTGGGHSRGLSSKLKFQGMFGLSSGFKTGSSGGTLLSVFALCRRKAINHNLFSIIQGEQVRDRFGFLCQRKVTKIKCLKFFNLER